MSAGKGSDANRSPRTIDILSRKAQAFSLPLSLTRATTWFAAAGEQFFDQVAADESRGAGHQYFHGAIL